jgi:hypothetical protein
MNRSRRVAMKIEVSNHSSSFIEQIDGVTKSVDSVTKLIKTVASLLLAIAGIGLIILMYYKT